MRGLGARRFGARGFGLNAISRLVLALLLVAMLAMPLVSPGVQTAAANGAFTYWVDVATGSDSNPGTEAEPFKTITKAASVAYVDDTIMVRPGTYSAAAGEVFPIWISGASLIGTGGASSTIVQGNGVDSILGVQYVQGGDAISGLTFTGAGDGPGAAINLYFNWPTGAEAVRIEDNVFEDNTSGSYSGGAIFAFATSSDENNLLIQGNYFENNTAGSSGSAIR